MLITYWMLRYVCDWTIFPWINSDEDGWEFTWLFLLVGRISIDAFEELQKRNEDG